MEENTELTNLFNQLFPTEEEQQEVLGYSFISEVDVDDNIETVKAIDSDEERLKDLYKAKIDKIKMELDSKVQKLENKKSWILFNLKGIVKNSPGLKETKTQFSKDYLSGKIVIKKPITKLIKPELTEDDIVEKFAGYKKEKVELDWAGLKKDLKIIDGKVIDTLTGEDLSTLISTEEVGEIVSVK